MIRRLYEISVSAKTKSIPGWKYLYKINKGIVNWLYPLIHKNDGWMGIEDEGEIIVSLTSFNDRIHLVWITITSIMNQTLKPKKIILWLASEQFPRGEEELPDNLLRLKRRGLEIRFCEDLKPHKKYYFVMQENPNDVIVTIDDDIFYPENHLEMLWKKHQEYPDAVCCWFAHRISFTDDGKFKKYNEWESDVSGYLEPTQQLLAVGCGGVLYPVSCMPKDLFRKEKINKLCLYADDLWLNMMESLHGIKVVRCVKDSQIFFGFLETRHQGLFATNADLEGNDSSIERILSEYPQWENIIYKNE